MRPQVAIVQRRLTHYRVPLFECMRHALADRGVDLRVLHGEPTAAERQKRDEGRMAWAEPLPTRYAAQGRLMWQPFMHRVGDCDLVIVPQENKHLHNLPPLLNPWRRQKMAYWGHGRNMQSRDPGGSAERFKRWLVRRVDWWFAYTELSADHVRDCGFPDERITVLNNSIDTRGLRLAVASAAQQPRGMLRKSLGLGTGPIGVFMGSLYPDKRMPFLLEATRQIQSEVPGFQLVIAGDGPDRDLVAAAASQTPSIHWTGVLHGERKAQLLAAADLMLNPGLVGLGILDAMVAGLPMLTTRCALHSPEISYLESGRNGLITEDRMETFVSATVSLLRDGAALQRMAHAAATSGELYSIESMSARFVDGIQRALGAPQ